VKKSKKMGRPELISPNILYKLYVIYSTVNGFEASPFEHFIGNMTMQDYDIVRYKQNDDVIKAFKIGKKITECEQKSAQNKINGKRD
jgi:hypothetical protein